MDITQFFVSGREKAKLDGNHAAYRAHLSNRIRNLRKRLGIATKPRVKHTNKPAVTEDDIHGNREYVHLLILTSERAWADAMSMREAHAIEKQGITGSTRSHIISRLHKAANYASELHDLLASQEGADSNQNDVLEARAYAASLIAAMGFEKQSWETCMNRYSEARVIYSALATATKREIFRDLLSDPIDPSIRYAAYQSGVPRTTAVPIIARNYFPKDARLIGEVERLDPTVLKDQPTTAQTPDAGDVPKTITWRSRTVALEDASISTALASVEVASKKLTDALVPKTISKAKEKAAAYDEILIASQDAVDATKNAIDELVSEGVSQSDKRMQSLQVTRTAVTYEMISWRIGRNRVLVGGGDGYASDQAVPNEQAMNTARTASTKASLGRSLAQLKEKSVLYDAILQNLETIKGLPGVTSDSSLLEELDAKYNYFQALKSLTIARSYALLSRPERSLALLNLAVERCDGASQYLSTLMKVPEGAPPNISISSTQVQSLVVYMTGELQRFRGLVEVARLLNQSGDKEENHLLVANLQRYPVNNLDFEKLVSYPPKLEVIPVKPLFLDAAWNYIEYPGRGQATQSSQNTLPQSQSTSETQQQRKGWFTFGR